MTMKYLGLILVLALVAGQVLALGINENDSQPQHVQLERSLNDKLYAILENFKTTLHNGDDSIHLPPLDPYFNKELIFVINETTIKAGFIFDDVSSTGIAGYNIDEAYVNIFYRTANIQLTWPEIFANSNYTFAVIIADQYQAFGKGYFTIKATDLVFRTTMKVNVWGGYSVESMDTKISLGGLKLYITGLLYDQQISEIVSKTVSDMTPQLLQIYQQQITAIVNEKAMEAINAYLKG